MYANVCVVCVQQCRVECVNGRAWVFLSTDSMPCTIRRLLTKLRDVVCHYRRGRGTQYAAVTNVIP